MKNLGLFVFNAILEIGIIPPQVRAYRVRVAQQQGIISYLRDRYGCFIRKSRLKRLTYVITPVSMGQIYLGHNVDITDHLIKRVCNLREFTREFPYRQYVTLRDITATLPSDEPIKLLKQGNRYIVVSGNDTQSLDTNGESISLDSLLETVDRNNNDSSNNSEL